MSGISPWAKGQTSPSWIITTTRDHGEIMNLTGVTTGQLSLAIYNATFTLIGTGAGAFSIVSANPGIVEYTPAVADSTIIGNLFVRIVVNYNNVNKDMSDYIAWQVQN